MKRKRLTKTKPSAAPIRRRLRSKEEIIEEQINTPSRPAPTLVQVGLKSSFKPWELRKLTSYGIEKVYKTSWLVVFKGPGYIDMERCATRKLAKSAVSMFKLRYPSVKVEWLKGESNASADNAARGISSPTTVTSGKSIQRKRRSSQPKSGPGRKRRKS